MDIGRASELVAAVQPVKRAPEAESDRQRAARDSSQQVLDVVQREALMQHYAENLQSQSPQPDERRAQRALDTYSAVALNDKRELLADMLGVSEYA